MGGPFLRQFLCQLLTLVVVLEFSIVGVRAVVTQEEPRDHMTTARQDGKEVIKLNKILFVCGKHEYIESWVLSSVKSIG